MTEKRKRIVTVIGTWIWGVTRHQFMHTNFKILKVHNHNSKDCDHVKLSKTVATEPSGNYIKLIRKCWEWKEFVGIHTGNIVWLGIKVKADCWAILTWSSLCFGRRHKRNVCGQFGLISGKANTLCVTFHFRVVTMALSVENDYLKANLYIATHFNTFLANNTN